VENEEATIKIGHQKVFIRPTHRQHMK